MKCFHHNDMDGYCSAAIVAAETKDYNQDDYIEIDYVTPIPVHKINEGETVYFVDYSFSGTNINALKEILNRNCNLIWIDHHKTSIALLDRYPEFKSIPGIVREGESGALLTYKFFHKSEIEKCLDIPHPIELVSDYDCWQFKYGDETTFFKLGVDSEDSSPLSSFWYDVIYDGQQSGKRMEQTIKNGRLLKNYVDEQNTWYRNHYGFISEINGIPCFALNLKTNSWVFGKAYDDYPLCVAFAYNGERYVYTLYSSKSDIDCAAIAGLFGGGGHAGAAGFSTETLILNKFKETAT